MAKWHIDLFNPNYAAAHDKESYTIFLHSQFYLNILLVHLKPLNDPWIQVSNGFVWLFVFIKVY